jgi:hypothetical protein
VHWLESAFFLLDSQGVGGGSSTIGTGPAPLCLKGGSADHLGASGVTLLYQTLWLTMRL